MGGPEEVNVARLDLPLEPEVVSAAQDEVSHALFSILSKAMPSLPAFSTYGIE